MPEFKITTKIHIGTSVSSLKVVRNKKFENFDH